MTTESKTSTTANEWRVTIENTVVMSKRKQEGRRDIRQCFASSQKRSKVSKEGVELVSQRERQKVWRMKAQGELVNLVLAQS
ncbi:unnamed protein product [Arctogadus glacialis]